MQLKKYMGVVGKLEKYLDSDSINSIFGKN